MTALIETIEAATDELEPHEAVLAVSEWLAEIPNHELAALLYAWDLMWAREEQVIPQGPWRSWGFLAARRLGKTRACAEFVNAEVMAGRARRVGLIAQTEDTAIDVLVHGITGLIETAPPWFRPAWVRDELVWPNGAIGSVFTPEVPGNIRGPGLELAWATELQSWPTSTRDEAWSNFQIMTSIGYAKTVWDCTPKRGHPILKELLARAERDPEHHHVVRGTMHANAINLASGFVEELERRIGGTTRGLEELQGVLLDSAEGALWRTEWIERNRRKAPSAYVRRIISIDPAISTSAHSDLTGIVELGLGSDDQIYVIDDLSGKHDFIAWGRTVVDRYLRSKCDCIIIERNRGGDMARAGVEIAARERGISVIVVDSKATTRFSPSTIYVKETNVSESKDTRAEPAAGLYQRGLVSHVIGAELTALEELLTTWEPLPAPGEGSTRIHRAKSPDALDALVQGVWELAHLADDRIDYKRSFAGIDRVAAALQSKVGPTVNAAAVLSALSRGARGGRL